MRLVSLLFAVACSGAPTDVITTDSTATTETGTTTTDTDTVPEPTDLATLQGSVVDPDGVGLGAVLRLCRGSACRTLDADSDGSYVYEDVALIPQSFEISAPSGHDDLAIAFAPLEFKTVHEVRAIPVILPVITHQTPLTSTATEIEVGTGLFITVSKADLEPPDAFHEDPTEVTGVAVDVALQMPVDRPHSSVIAMWYVGPFDYMSEGGLPVRIQNLWGLADGAVYSVWTGSYLDSAWLDQGTLTVSGEWLEGDAALTVVSTVVLVAL